MPVIYRVLKPWEESAHLSAFVSSRKAAKEIAHKISAKAAPPKPMAARAMITSTMPLANLVQNIGYSSFNPPYRLSL